MSRIPFSELSLEPELLKAIERMGFETASPIQSESIPPLLAGRDLVGQSMTGSGKTAAFGVPVVQRVDAHRREIQALILCPTRELAAQVAEEIARLAFFKKGVREVPVYGGASYERQFRALDAGPQIVIGTPGRVIDHIERGSLKLDNVSMVVLDEADRMLDMGFREDIERILESVPSQRQTILFSATLPPPIRKIVERFTVDPAQIRIDSSSMMVPAIAQSYIEVDYRSKTEVLCRLLDVQDISYGLVFGFTKAQVDELTETLVARGYNADKLHGDMAQGMRERTMKRFRERKLELLVATDVAARGLDVDDLEMVINYELPQDPEDYVHRIGRTGRAGKTGRAVSLVSGREFGRLQNILRFTKSDIVRMPVPLLTDLQERHAGRIADSMRAALAAGGYQPQDELLGELTDAGYSPGEIFAAAVHLLTMESARPVERIIEDDVRPKRERRLREPDGDNRPERNYRDRGEGREPREHREFTGETWLRFNVGREARVTPRDLVGCIAGESGLDSACIGQIHILPTITLVQIDGEAAAERILASVNGARLCGRRVGVSPGQPPRPGGPPRRGGFGNAGPGDGPPRRKGPPRREY